MKTFIYLVASKIKLSQEKSVSYLRISIGGLLLGIMSCAVFAEGNSNKQINSVGLGATRLIYPSGSKGVMLRVENYSDHPYLVKSVVLDENRHDAAPFIVTPPLFRLDSGQRNILTITRTGGDFPDDRESVKWMCVQSISPETDSAWAGGSKNGSGNDKVAASVRLLPGSCIKLLVRPEVIKGNPVDVADKVSWHVSGKTITATNPTPFYMNISQASFNGRRIKTDKGYIPPFSEENYPLPGKEMKGTIKWSVIGDYGETREKTFSVK
ncbi:TPA: molecular chaperone [Salmonella enterica subsp. enterica serovar Reading]